MLGSNERKQIIEEEDAKALAETQEGKSASSGSKGKKKKTSSARLEAIQCSPAKAKLLGDQWEIIPATSQQFSVPAMPKVAVPAVEEHRPKLRELAKEKIKELEFKSCIRAFRFSCQVCIKRRSCQQPQGKNRPWQGVWKPPD